MTAPLDEVGGRRGEEDLLAVVVGAPVHVLHGVRVQQGGLPVQDAENFNA